jgi:hypothetical protein
LPRPSPHGGIPEAAARSLRAHRCDRRALTVTNARRAALVAGGLLALGCLVLVLWLREGSGPTVTGTVRLDGQLLPTGSIALIPVEGTPGPGGGGEIKEGKYTIKQGLRAGRYRFEIRSTHTLGRLVPNPTIPLGLVNEEVSIIPEEYNTRSTLIREVLPGANVLNFDDLKGASARR